MEAIDVCQAHGRRPSHSTERASWDVRSNVERAPDAAIERMMESLRARGGFGAQCTQAIRIEMGKDICPKREGKLAALRTSAIVAPGGLATISGVLSPTYFYLLSLIAVSGNALYLCLQGCKGVSAAQAQVSRSIAETSSAVQDASQSFTSSIEEVQQSICSLKDAIQKTPDDLSETFKQAREDLASIFDELDELQRHASELTEFCDQSEGVDDECSAQQHDDDEPPLPNKPR